MALDWIKYSSILDYLSLKRRMVRFLKSFPNALALSNLRMADSHRMIFWVWFLTNIQRNQTRDSLIGSANSASVLCSPLLHEWFDDRTIEEQKNLLRSGWNFYFFSPPRSFRIKNPPEEMKIEKRVGKFNEAKYGLVKLLTGNVRNSFN